MISIIIPTYNEEKYLPRLLESIKNQTRQDFEVIVADSDSTDQTRQIAQGFGAKIVRGGKPAHGRNQGARIAQGQYLVFLDADVVLANDFFEKAMHEFDQKYYEIATVILYPDSKLDIDKIIFFFTNLIIESAQYFYPHAPGACIIVTKRMHQRLNGFDEKLAMSEDHDYVERASKLAKYGVLKNAHVFLSVRRLDNEGRLNLLKKYLLLDIYRFINKKIDKQIVPYEFGNFQEAKELTKVEKYLEKTINRANKLKQDFKQFMKE